MAPIILGICCVMALPLRAEWLTDLEAAKKTGKPILMNFTGSDWCGWCIKLKNEVFSQPEFESYAQKRLTLLEVDFPRSKFQTEERKVKNRALRDEYGIEGYPTIILLDAKGKKVGELGYMPGGPKAFIAEVEKVLPAKKGGNSGKPYY